MTPNRKVLDLSHHNSVNSWADVKRAGIVGIIHKATEGTGFVDNMYDDRMLSEVRNNVGLLWGAYHFLRPGDMRAQAQFFVDVAGLEPNMIYAADHEDDGVSLDNLKTFCAEVERLTGKPPIIYSGNVIKEQLGNRADPELARYPLWLAHYSSNPTWPTATWPEFWLWQYADGDIGPNPKGCPGVEGYVDTNSYGGTDEQLISEWCATPAPTPEPEKLVVKVIAPAGIRIIVVQPES